MKSRKTIVVKMVFFERVGLLIEKIEDVNLLGYIKSEIQKDERLSTNLTMRLLTLINLRIEEIRKYHFKEVLKQIIYYLFSRQQSGQRISHTATYSEIITTLYGLGVQNLLDRNQINTLKNLLETAPEKWASLISLIAQLDPDFGRLLTIGLDEGISVLRQKLNQLTTLKITPPNQS